MLHLNRPGSPGWRLLFVLVISAMSLGQVAAGVASVRWELGPAIGSLGDLQEVAVRKESIVAVGVRARKFTEFSDPVLSGGRSD